MSEFLFSPLMAMLLVSYLIGSVPFGLLLFYVNTGQDLRKIGSGNIGATNVLRNAGKKLALLTLLLDSSKAAFCSILALLSWGEWAAALCGIAAILGHNFSCFLKFKGGKGAASSMAVVLILNWQLGLIGASVWLISAALFRIASFAAIVAFSLMNGLVFVLSDKPHMYAVISVVTLLILFQHRSNIKRLYNGEEPPIGTAPLSLAQGIKKIRKLKKA